MKTSIPSTVEYWDDEREIGNSLIVTLKPGFAFEYYPGDVDGAICEHVRGFDTVAEARAACAKKRLHICDCGSCKKELRK